ncbi:malate synthase G [Alteromonas sp. a30]|uniref:malate synthase G n=1 Tax=Alteromonas sp. a30 TaxID=2730917 RepID=UPI002282DCDE|nr:malate synthase G [Alteromonas sp. a30]MCY7294492.1 malate synthase G [Alteromonas sp. a30]
MQNPGDSTISIGQLTIDARLFQFINEEALPGTQVEQTQFWADFEQLLVDLVPVNQALLAKREQLQQEIDRYAKAHLGRPNPDEYKTLLQNIGYLEPKPAPFKIGTQHVDAEIAQLAGPQLVVPISNARYALNAVNARWGSLYDALYGTDVIPKTGNEEPGYDAQRGEKVITYARNWLNTHFPLKGGSHHDATNYQITNNQLVVTLKDGSETCLQSDIAYQGYQGEAKAPESILLIHNGLHIELQFDAEHPIGKDDIAHMKDIAVESALTTIIDCEDSVAAVDAEDKIHVYRNWLGLMRGTLKEEISKGDKSILRKMRPDREYKDKNGKTLTLPGRALMFVRNVGHLMTSDAILLNGEAIPEGIMDGVITSLIAKHDLLGNSKVQNSREGSVYIVKPKMHGSEEVAFANTLFDRIESLLHLAPNTLKMGIMDEERRTSVNLAACIAAAKDRVVFINTGFLDRTGDEIHTSMLFGPFAPKATLKTLPWIQAYERSNVATGLAAGMSGRAQIGKGMWPEPDNMAAMMSAKIAHPKAGANTAWVPSPTAATLHALHYHEVDVAAVQQSLLAEEFDGLDDILNIPLMDESTTLSADELQREIDNNVQGILGYVVRWVNQGVGCSKVPDINNVGLMEDRATLRISSQHLANWLCHNIITEEQVRESMAKMAKFVDEQNANDPEYIPMLPDLENSIAFQAAQDLIFEGMKQPSGYTEPVLHQKRQALKASLRP